MTPAPGETVRDGQYGKGSRTYTFLACDRCGEGVWVYGRAPDQGRLAEEDYRQAHGRPCRLTPRCPGRHLVA